MWHGQRRNESLNASINCKQATLITQDDHLRTSTGKALTSDCNVNFKRFLWLMLGRNET